MTYLGRLGGLLTRPLVGPRECHQAQSAGPGLAHPHPVSRVLRSGCLREMKCQLPLPRVHLSTLPLWVLEEAAMFDLLGHCWERPSPPPAPPPCQSISSASAPVSRVDLMGPHLDPK